ncbi:non-receptor serine/threonine protein kinase [Lithospermum erythrorhizon]|uniref:Non-receptor serine/threonine protein kinase n=1 Tax=Lithospermum erythrorhizon TaxID=34254 RepID=A0AAV3R1C4_LITER
MPSDLENSSSSVADLEGGAGDKPKSSTKKKRNLPGMPDPDAEVIALSPKSLLATNRFVCEICNKGFQRDQNLQLHRRGHNLPWKLRQRTSNEVKKRVYVCPEVGCVHHDPSRALGDLTGIKKHFCRKHGEKKWTCEKCSKKYAVQSDWKAHAKICGTREYKCDCGTLFSRRDSFITHRAFCDKLAEESAKSLAVAAPPSGNVEPQEVPTVALSPQPPSPAPLGLQPSPRGTPVIDASMPDQTPEAPEELNPSPSPGQISEETNGAVGLTGRCTSVSLPRSTEGTTSSVYASLFASSTPSGSLLSESSGFTNLFRAMPPPEPLTDVAPSSTEPISLCLSTNHITSIFGTMVQERRQYASSSQPAMSATALLQKAAQMGASSSGSLLRALDVVSSSTSSNGQQEWTRESIEPKNTSLAAGLGLGLPCDGGSSLKELMMGAPSVFGPKHTTLDLLGLGMAAGGGSNDDLSALMTSMGGGLDATTAAAFGIGEFSGKDLGMGS